VCVSGSLPEDIINGRIDDAYSVTATGAEGSLNTAELSVGGRIFTVDLSFDKENWKDENPGTVLFVSTDKGA
ncbi:MAG: hypothetical protein IJU95_09710, partial [Treponema sp.]|nr:hypothetical protein [Treponema sp.]